MAFSIPQFGVARQFAANQRDTQPYAGFDQVKAIAGTQLMSKLAERDVAGEIAMTMAALKARGNLVSDQMADTLSRDLMDKRIEYDREVRKDNRKSRLLGSLLQGTGGGGGADLLGSLVQGSQEFGGGNALTNLDNQLGTFQSMDGRNNRYLKPVSAQAAEGLSAEGLSMATPTRSAPATQIQPTGNTQLNPAGLPAPKGVKTTTNADGTIKVDLSGL